MSMLHSLVKQVGLSPHLLSAAACELPPRADPSATTKTKTRHSSPSKKKYHINAQMRMQKISVSKTINIHLRYEWQKKSLPHSEGERNQRHALRYLCGN